MKKLSISLSVILFTGLIFLGCQKDFGTEPDQLSKASILSVKAEFDVPILSCGSNAGETYLELVVTAGTSGAPEGFTLQWVTKDELDANAGEWPEEYCEAGFSGNANNSRYNLASGGSVTLKVGDFLNDNGFSTECGGELECGTEYAFRVFAKASSDYKKSDFSEPFNCSTESCEEECWEGETAFGGDNAVNVGEKGAWFFYYNNDGSEQFITAGQYFEAGTIQYTGGNIVINLAEGWRLKLDETESVKIKGYSEQPTERPNASGPGWYKGNELTVPFENLDYYIIHLDVEQLIECP